MRATDGRSGRGEDAAQGEALLWHPKYLHTRCSPPRPSTPPVSGGYSLSRGDIVDREATNVRFVRKDALEQVRTVKTGFGSQPGENPWVLFGTYPSIRVCGPHPKDGATACATRCVVENVVVDFNDALMQCSSRICQERALEADAGESNFIKAMRAAPGGLWVSSTVGVALIATTLLLCFEIFAVASGNISIRAISGSVALFTFYQAVQVLPEMADALLRGDGSS